MFLKLKRNFKPIAHEDYYELVDNNTVNEYSLNEEQYQIILLLDGTKTEKQILAQYDQKSQPVVIKFFKKMKAIGALEDLISSDKRVILRNIVSPYLEAVLWDITSFCNLQCPHCYVSDYYCEQKGKDLSTKEIFQVIDEMDLMNVRDVSITGGEPLVRKDINKIITKISKSNIRFASLFTNGFAVTQKFVDFLAPQVGQEFRVRHSLDGSSPESNACLRGKQINSYLLFEKMVNSIKMFVDAGIFVSVGTGIHCDNVHELVQMYSFMKDLGVAQWRLAIPKPMGRFKSNSKNLSAESKDIFKELEKLIDIHLSEVKIKQGKLIAPISIEIEQVFRTELLVKTMNTFCKNDIACFYHKNRCSIKANGDIIPCGYFDGVIAGNVKKDSLQKSWESSTMQDIKQLKVDAIEECRDCELLSLCGTGCRAMIFRETGLFTKKDTAACDRITFFKSVIIPLFNKHGFVLNLSNGCAEFSKFKNI